ncbi:hypothetical protein CHARACLAT_006556 [Characodon lateralis]|uniref:Uncharacterized protein n=1 Tax=Characodon lateralis TaxID=208331 RepID=A0ABU7CVD2_9TELE|nr:hypothetical protein [Characodon lateralis]
MVAVTAGSDRQAVAKSNTASQARSPPVGVFFHLSSFGPSKHPSFCPLTIPSFNTGTSSDTVNVQHNAATSLKHHAAEQDNSLQASQKHLMQHCTGVTSRCCCATVAYQRAINLGSKGVEKQREASACCLTRK